ncbi:hypothetical protein ACFVHB_36050 [Kitasatospora sp. NPDC127111]|uniref:hypothetical protein n=1 Tax=Kitasatospora sp. NPDC127111 TaxID=3345363 RepID=UPI003645579B
MDEDQGQAGPVDAARARELTWQLRTVIEDVRVAVLVLARRVRAAHQVRVWTGLGHSSWSVYALAEFGIGRSMAYWLLDLAAAAEAIEGTFRAALGVSHAWDSTDLVHQDAGCAPLPAELVGGIVAAAVRAAHPL